MYFKFYPIDNAFRPDHKLISTTFFKKRKAMIKNSVNDYILHLAFQVCSAIYATTLSIKVIGANNKLFVNGLIIIILFSYITNSVVVIIQDTFEINKVSYSISTILVINTVTAAFVIFPYVFVINLRNHILIKNKIILLLTKFLVFITFISYVLNYIILDLSVVFSSNSPIKYNKIFIKFLSIMYPIGSIAKILLSVSVGILDILSVTYLLLYYKKYYFRSKSVMKYLQFQMIYRRNWIYFVIFIEIMSLGLVATSLLKIYQYPTEALVKMLILFQLDTLIDFVKFDTIRNEITIGDHTIRLLNNSEPEQQ